MNFHVIFKTAKLKRKHINPVLAGVSRKKTMESKRRYLRDYIATAAGVSPQDPILMEAQKPRESVITLPIISHGK